MSLEQLKTIEREANSIASDCEKHEQAEKLLAALRNGPQTLSDIFINANSRWNYGCDELAKSALIEVINEAKLDILRLAELRLAAKARELKIEAARRRAIITASILPLPEIKS